jgi:hypothetical protein
MEKIIKSYDLDLYMMFKTRCPYKKIKLIELPENKNVLRKKYNNEIIIRPCVDLKKCLMTEYCGIGSKKTFIEELIISRVMKSADYLHFFIMAMKNEYYEVALSMLRRINSPQDSPFFYQKNKKGESGYMYWKINMGESTILPQFKPYITHQSPIINDLINVRYNNRRYYELLCYKYSNEIISVTSWFKIIHDKKMHNIIRGVIAYQKSLIDALDKNGNSALYYILTNEKSIVPAADLLREGAKYIVANKEITTIKTNNLFYIYEFPIRFIYADRDKNTLQMVRVMNGLTPDVSQIYNWQYTNKKGETIIDLIDASRHFSDVMKYNLIWDIAGQNHALVDKYADALREKILCMAITCPLCRRDEMHIAEITNNTSFDCIICAEESKYNVKLNCNHNDMCMNCIFALYNNKKKYKGISIF